MATPLSSGRRKFSEPVYRLAYPNEALAARTRERQERLHQHFDKQRIFCTPLQSPDFIRTTNRQGGVFLQFLPVTGAESYEITVAADANSNNVLRRETWEGEKNTEGFISLGNINQEVFVRVRTNCGEHQSSTFSFTACGTSTVTGTSSTIDPVTPEVPPEPINPDLGDDILPEPEIPKNQNLPNKIVT